MDGFVVFEKDGRGAAVIGVDHREVEYVAAVENLVIHIVDVFVASEECGINFLAKDMSHFGVYSFSISVLGEGKEERG